jgi:hypothetical protein
MQLKTTVFGATNQPPARINSLQIEPGFSFSNRSWQQNNNSTQICFSDLDTNISGISSQPFLIVDEN